MEPPHQFQQFTGLRLLKELTWYYVIKGQRLATQQVGFDRVIRDLFDVYYTAIERGDWHVLPPRFAAREIYDDDHEMFDNLDEGQRIARLVADIVSSMTDREALTMHRRLHGLSPGSVMDITVL